MKRKNFEPLALPTIPVCDFVFHVVRRVSPLGNVKWIVRRVRYESYVIRLRYHGDDGMYFASECVAQDTVTIKEKYEFDVLPHALNRQKGGVE